MIWFVLICGAIAAAVLLSLLHALRGAARSKTNLQAEIEEAARRENIEITRERLAALPDDAAHEADRIELEAALADDLGQLDALDVTPAGGGNGSRSALMFLIAAPVIAGALYLTLGDTTWVRQVELPTPAEIRDNPQQSMAALIERLEQALIEAPDNPAGWSLAGRTYLSMGRYAEAEAAYEKANALQPNDSELLAAWSDAALLVNGNRYTPEIGERIERALQIDPNNANALWIAGMGNISNGNVDNGLGFLERLQPVLAEQPELLQQITAIIEQVRGSQSASRPEVNADGPFIVVNLSIDAELLADTPLDTTVFVFASAVDGPPMPLAAQRLTVAELPTAIQLDESSAMMPGRTIADVDEVTVVARLSYSGQPVAQAGDISSEPVTVEPGQGDTINIVIGRQ